MSLVKGAMLLLLLAVIGINAAPGPEDCDGLNKTLSAPDLHKVSGDWVLVWSVADNTTEMIGNLSSSHAQINVLEENKTIAFNERNVFHVGPAKLSCVKYSLNMSTPTDPDQHLLHVTEATEDKDGVVSPYDSTGKVNFYESCPDCLVMEYSATTYGRFLLIYRRQGHHRSSDPSAPYPMLEKLAGCLGLPHDKPFIYNGQTDYCQTGKILSMGDDALEYQPASM